MRLDIPSPLGARILLADNCPSFLLISLISVFSISSSVFFCRLVDVQEVEAGRPTVENWPGRTEETKGESGQTEFKNKGDKGREKYILCNERTVVKLIYSYIE